MGNALTFLCGEISYVNISVIIKIKVDFFYHFKLLYSLCHMYQLHRFVNLDRMI